MIHTASWEEILITLLGMAALIYNILNYRASHLGVQVIKTEGINGRFLRIARQYRRNDLARVLKQVGFLVVWVLALMSPNPVGDPATIRTILLRTVVIAMQTWLVWGAYMDKGDRDWLQSNPRTYGAENGFDPAWHSDDEEEAAGA